MEEVRLKLDRGKRFVLLEHGEDGARQEMVRQGGDVSAEQRADQGNDEVVFDSPLGRSLARTSSATGCSSRGDHRQSSEAAGDVIVASESTPMPTNAEVAAELRY